MGDVALPPGLAVQFSSQDLNSGRKKKSSLPRCPLTSTCIMACILTPTYTHSQSISVKKSKNKRKKTAPLATQWPGAPGLFQDGAQHHSRFPSSERGSGFPQMISLHVSSEHLITPILSTLPHFLACGPAWERSAGEGGSGQRTDSLADALEGGLPADTATVCVDTTLWREEGA